MLRMISLLFFRYVFLLLTRLPIFPPLPFSLLFEWSALPPSHLRSQGSYECSEAGMCFCDPYFTVRWAKRAKTADVRSQSFHSSPPASFSHFPFPFSLPLPFSAPLSFWPAAGNLIKQGVSQQIVAGERLVMAGSGKGSQEWKCLEWKKCGCV